MSRKGGFGKLLGGIALGTGLGMLLAPDKGENTRKVLMKKINNLLDKAKEVDLDEVKDELLYKVETLQAELKSLDSEKAKDIAVEKAKKLKSKAEELYKYALEKGTPVLEKAADEVRKQSVKVLKDLQNKIDPDKNTKKSKK